jgi:hypothetical protein
MKIQFQSEAIKEIVPHCFEENKKKELLINPKYKFSGKFIKETGGVF